MRTACPQGTRCVQRINRLPENGLIVRMLYAVCRQSALCVQSDRTLGYLRGGLDRWRFELVAELFRQVGGDRDALARAGQGASESVSIRAWAWALCAAAV